MLMLLLEMLPVLEIRSFYALLRLFLDDSLATDGVFRIFLVISTNSLLAELRPVFTT